MRDSKCTQASKRPTQLKFWRRDSVRWKVTQLLQHLTAFITFFCYYPVVDSGHRITSQSSWARNYQHDVILTSVPTIRLTSPNEILGLFAVTVFLVSHEYKIYPLTCLAFGSLGSFVPPPPLFCESTKINIIALFRVSCSTNSLSSLPSSSLKGWLHS